MADSNNVNKLLISIVLKNYSTNNGTNKGFK